MGVLQAGGSSGGATLIPGDTSSNYSFTVARASGTCDISVVSGWNGGPPAGVSEGGSTSSGIYPATPTVSYNFTRNLVNIGNGTGTIVAAFSEVGGGTCTGTYSPAARPAAYVELVQNEIYLSSRQVDGGALYRVPNGGIWWRRLRNLVQRAAGGRRVGQLWPI